MLNFYRRASLNLLLIIVLSLSSQTLSAQVSIVGNVLDKKSNKPIPNVSISINRRRSGSLSDLKGHFAVPVSSAKTSDTLVLSSVGYSTLRMPIAQALYVKDFFLAEDSKELDNVTIKTYKNEAAEGSISEVTGFFRSWTTRRGGGEIGRIIYVNSDDYKVERIRFKTNNQCDTCIVRLHIRDLTNGLPDMDLLQDSISIVLKRSSFDDKYAEFDLRDKNIIIKKNKYVFVSLETLRCNSINSGNCSLCYIGTEHGNFLYRTRDYRAWEESADHSLYLRMFYKY